MKYYNMLLNANKIFERLQDEQSREIFLARINYMVERDLDSYNSVTDSFNEDKVWYLEELEQCMEKCCPKGIIIYGGGHDGVRTKKVVEKSGYVVDYFCDNDSSKVGKTIEGIPVISQKELLEKYCDYVVIIGTRKYCDEVYKELILNKYPSERILKSVYGIPLAVYGKQYFDVFKPKENEIFVDAGAYDGNTIRDFVSWTAGNYSRVYALEPVAELCEVCKEKKMQNVMIYNNAAWDREEMLHFSENEAAASRIEEEGNIVVHGRDIDGIVNNDKVTYIKLDVEGSELKALQGARKTIINNKPRLAVCIYHTPWDIIELPLYILELVPEYKFYIRHYSSDIWETVLYATVE